jgi:putative transcriptional regulator
VAFVSHQGRLLIAAPVLIDPNFHRTVVLLTEHTEEAAMGLVLNRPMPIVAAEAVPVLAEVVDDGAPLYQGGPVQPASVLALADFVDPAQSAGIAFGSVGYVDAEMGTDELAPLVQRIRVFAGYSGWGPSQLEGELAEDAWFVADADPEDVFGPPEDLWKRVLERLGGHYAFVATMPENPRLN